MRRLGDCHGRMPWPRRGGYFFFEPGEYRGTAPGVQRIVRVGTHAVTSNSNSTLWSRLYSHRGTRDGGGNHRGSIFRLNIGLALLEKEGNADAFPTWGKGSSASRHVVTQERSLEVEVSRYIGAMSLVWVAVDDEPGKSSDRAFIERNAISLLSGFRNPSDTPSGGWLGRYSTKPAIRESGLWNVRYTSDSYDPCFLEVLADYVRMTIIAYRGRHETNHI